jgi:hypothetical protein
MTFLFSPVCHDIAVTFPTLSLFTITAVGTLAVGSTTGRRYATDQ